MSSSPSMSCPSGGTFYACLDESKFVGCCASNPCGTNGCPAGNLYAASFSQSQYGDYSDQECDTGQFWTCRDATPPFWGCCKSNPCNAGCPSGDLAGAYLSNNPSDAAPFEALNGTSSSDTSTTALTATLASPTATAGPATTASTASSTMAGISSAETAVGTASSSPSSAAASSSGHSTNAGAIAGGVVGGFAVLAALVFGLVWLLRRRKNSASCHTAEVQQPGESTLGHGKVEATKQDTASYYHQPTTPISPQPPYSPAPPSYLSEPEMRHISHELPGTVGGYEMESGQRYHAYRA